MQPDQNPVPIDYLDTIAPQPTKQAMGNKLFFGIIIGAFIVVILTIIAISGSGDKEAMTRLGLRLQTLQKTSNDAEKNIQSNVLLSTNGNLKSYLLNTSHGLEEPLEAAGIKLKKADKKLVAEESGTELNATLEDARLNAKFDRIYASEMSYQLETTALLINTLYDSTNKKSLKAFLPGAYKDINDLKKQMDDFSAGATTPVLIPTHSYDE